MSESVVVFKMLEHNLDIDEVTQKLLAVITDWLRRTATPQMYNNRCWSLIYVPWSVEQKRVKPYQKSISAYSMKFLNIR